ncbi:MAG: DCC1-like thiol-disulfide oxidoreductase family protein [Pseudomonadota bacterium]
MSRLGPELRGRFADRDIIVFDGECVLCSGFFRFMLRHDREAQFSFAMAQAEVGQACYAALGMPLDDFQTNLVIKDGWIYTDLDAFAAAMSALGWPWKGLAVVRYLPGVVKRPIYRAVAANRYRLFGRYDQCIRPGPEVRARFVEEGLV